MTRVGLVLGAGGVVGQAYHAGVLAALERELGWDPRSADVVVGSSAGSITGTLLRLGVTAGDLRPWPDGSPLSHAGGVGDRSDPAGSVGPPLPTTPRLVEAVAPTVRSPCWPGSPVARGASGPTWPP